MKALEKAEGRGSNPYYEGNFDGESDELRDLRLSLVAERDELMAELEGRHQSIIEMGNMLTEIVNLIRGEPEEGTSHSTHDAVARVRSLDEFATEATTAVAKLKEENERLLAANLDCIAHYEDARAELERIKSLEPVAWIRQSGKAMLEAGGYCTVYASDGMRNHSTPLYALGSKTA